MSNNKNKKRLGRDSNTASDPDSGPGTIPGASLISSIANGYTQPISLLGQLPNEILENILARVDQPSIGAFGLAARWCHVHADEMYFRTISLTPISLIYLTLNPQHIPKIRKIKVDCRMVGVLNANTINFISSLTNLRTISLHSINSKNHTRVLHYILKFIPTTESLHRLEISIGHNTFRRGTPRIIGSDDPNWDALDMDIHPNLKEISYDFGPMAASITRMDSLVFNTFIPHRHSLKVLEVNCIQLRRYSQTFREGLKHYIFRCAEEEVNPQHVWTPDVIETYNSFQDSYIACLASDSLEVFRFFSDMRKDVSDSREREISIEEVCTVWPNLKHLDFVTRDSWKTNFRQLPRPKKLTKLRTFTHSGITKTSTEAANPAWSLTESDNLPKGPIEVSPRSVMDYLTRHWFPNIHSYGWYSRDSTSMVFPDFYMIEIRHLRKVWWVLHQSWAGWVTVVASYWPGPAFLNHWWGPGATSIYI
ncbi:hypothetical protein TWF970_001226 [Orbilia oligospora]|uniref:F-box domain-containing protein n=1 Tax=Orbilia oligospora TaxID=2813651 RepID=A0A7C8RE52_ORBOL|nr:hypothetical protein TWF970_001226 [Orbilia oligospora]